MQNRKDHAKEFCAKVRALSILVSKLKKRHESRETGAQTVSVLDQLRVFFRRTEVWHEQGPKDLARASNSTTAADRRRHAKAVGAVLVPVFEREGTVHVLYTRRAHHLVSHRGEVAFPGGKFDPADRSLLDTALRETTEEIGLERDAVEVLGQLPFAEVSRSGVAVTPYAGVVRSLDSLRPSPHEVAEVFSVPLEALRDPARRVPYRYPHADGTSTAYPGIEYNGRIIWGLTLRITITLLECVERAEALYHSGGQAAFRRGSQPS